MPINREFRDSGGFRGRPTSIHESISVPGKLSRSYDKNIAPADKVIQVELKSDRYYHLDFSKVVGGKIKISVTNMRKLVNWIVLADEQFM